MKRLSLILSGCLLAMPVLAQDAPTQKSFMDDPVNHPMLPYYVVFVLMFVALVLVAVVAVYVIRTLSLLTEEAKKSNAEKLGVAYTPEPGWWQRFSQQMNASVPLEQEKNIELDHSYDGIKELDNHLPPWWKWLFYGTIGWAVVYMLWYFISPAHCLCHLKNIRMKLLRPRSNPANYRLLSQRH
jgi:cytochrome c oxidase cbb3-type subunit III